MEAYPLFSAIAQIGSRNVGCIDLDHGRLNLVRWPTLLLFIYKVVEYFVEQVFRQLRDKNNPSATYSALNSPHSHRFEWTGHFLIPSLHIVSVTLFLYRFVNKYNYSGPHRFKQLAKFVPLANKSGSRRRAAIRRGEYSYHKDSSTASLIEQPPPPPPPSPPSQPEAEIQMTTTKRKNNKLTRKLVTTTSFHLKDNDEEMQLCGQSGDEEEDDDEGDARVRLLEFDDRDEE
ncbi:hypothetical protein Fcan01_18228 [Folsomia candida]|uniref:Uncharacterized protein n=1 Tax=Folsomia candida TaxID=158441 RepID=A0A226DNK2_FOLCA|nr:hypothetical protein Fcan01_18228 [Folsomia candida]